MGLWSNQGDKKRLGPATTLYEPLPFPLSSRAKPRDLRFRGPFVQAWTLHLTQNCHLDRRVREWRDPRFLSDLYLPKDLGMPRNPVHPACALASFTCASWMISFACAYFSASSPASFHSFWPSSSCRCASPASISSGLIAFCARIVPRSGSTSTKPHTTKYV